MANLRRKDVQQRMPPEVRRRVDATGVSSKQVDWYAGRQYVAEHELELRRTPDDVRARTVAAAREHAAGENALMTLMRTLSEHAHALLLRIRGGGVRVP